MNKYVNQIALIIASFAVVNALCGCSNNSASVKKQHTLERVLAAQKVKAAVVPVDTLVEIDPATKQVTGYAIDVMNQVAQNAGIEVEYFPSEWSTMASELTTGRVDLVVGGIFQTESRAKEFSFTRPLFLYAVSAIVPTESNIQKPNDLNRAGLRIAVKNGDFAHEYVRRHYSEANLISLTGADLSLPMLEVLSGRADIALVDFATAKNFAAEHSDVKHVFVENPFALFAASFMMRQDDAEWQEFLNVCINNLDLSGELDVLDHKYAKDAPWFARPSIKQQLTQ